MLLVKVGGRLCSLGLASTIEIMRLQPCEPLAGAPSFVRGLAVIRGQPVPVIDLRWLLEGSPAEAATRLVSVRIGARTAALVVDQVIGVARIDRAALTAAPPLLGGASGDLVEALGTLDAELLLVLRAARLVPDEIFRLVDRRAEVA